MKTKLLIIFCAISSILSAQQPAIQYYRPNDKTGLNVFGPSKTDTTLFTGLKVRIGGNFTQDFQALNHENNANPVIVNNVNANKLPSLVNGFTLAMANLNINAQLADGVQLSLTLYLSSRHHEETWVKGGYVQFDKLPFIKSKALDDIMKSFTIKIGDYEVDYGDQHFRRTDGGNSIHNPFVENYIMDGFATEIGGEIYYHPQAGLIAMVGITNGALNPTVIESTKIDSVTNEPNVYAPAFHGKLGYDSQYKNDFRFRITGSVYAVKSAASSTLFAGDRTGSHYFMVLENTTATADGNFRSGRFAPSFSDEATTFMINPFIKYKGLELFGAYEMAKGRTITEKSTRDATQYAVDLIYRFPREKENLWIGGRYNSVKAKMPSYTNDVTINRMAGSIGWFMTNNIMMKAEYVNQEYKDFLPTDIRSGGKFNGFMLEASVGF